MSLRTTRHDSLRRATQILDKDDAQRDRHRPEFSDREWLNALVGVHKPSQCFQIEPAVGVCNECPRNPKYSWIPFEWPLGKFGEFAIKAAREVVVDFADLFIHDMKIIDQPLRRGRDHLFVVYGFGNGTIGLKQNTGIVSEPRCKRPASRGFWRDALSSRKTFCMLLEPFDAKELAPYRLFSILRKYTPRIPEGPKYGLFQCSYTHWTRFEN